VKRRTIGRFARLWYSCRPPT